MSRVRAGKNAKARLIAGVPLFAGCSKTELEKVAAIADELGLPDGAVLIAEGDSGREFIVIVDGTARVTRNGRKLGELGPGSFVGEIALVANVPRTATVTATSPVRVLVITERAFRELLTRSPGISTKVLQSLGERVQQLEQR